MLAILSELMKRAVPLGTVPAREHKADARHHIDCMPIPPRFIEPAAPLLRPTPPVGPDWSHEAKLDGWRVQVRRDPGGARLLSRTGSDITDRFKGIARAASLLAAGTILDGELVALGSDDRLADCAYDSLRSAGTGLGFGKS
jgi:ATP-dependent DNA ligase